MSRRWPTSLSVRAFRHTFGFMWSCPWRIEWRRQFEYWDRTQVGPFYVLHPPTRQPYEDTDDDEA